MDTSRKIIHIDMDAFYASVEQRDHPEFRGKPLIIGGDPNKRGVVATCSYEARKFGVHSAMPTRQAAKLCPNGIFIHGNMAHYVEVSNQIREIFSRYTDIIEPLSLDEAYLDVTENKKEFVMIGRLSVLVVAIVAIAIAWNPNDTILNLVGNAWAGFGASFSPLVLFALYWKGLTRAGAVSGMVSGALVVIVWIAWIKPLAHINEIFGLYEIIPGFIVSVIVTYVVSKLTKKPGAFVETDLNKVRDIVREK